MKNFLNNKKGTILDIILVCVFTFVIVILFVVAGIAYKKTGEALEETKEYISMPSYNESADLVINQADKYSNFWDYLIVFILFGTWLAIIMASYLLGNNPLFMVVFIIVLIALLIMSVVFQVAGRNMITNEGIAEFFEDFPITSFYVRYMFLFNLFFILLSGVALYLKTGVGG